MVLWLVNNQENCFIRPENSEKLLNFERESNPNTDIRIQGIQTNDKRYNTTKLKNNKATGRDAITTELRNEAEDSMVEILAKLLVGMWEINQIPKDWKYILLHPKDDKSVNRTSIIREASLASQFSTKYYRKLFNADYNNN